MTVIEQMSVDLQDTSSEVLIEDTTDVTQVLTETTETATVSEATAAEITVKSSDDAPGDGTDGVRVQCEPSDPPDHRANAAAHTDTSDVGKSVIIMADSQSCIAQCHMYVLRNNTCSGSSPS